MCYNGDRIETMKTNTRRAPMKCLIDIGNRYAKESDWKTITLLKFCLCAMGIMIGLKVPREKKQIWGWVELMRHETCEE